MSRPSAKELGGTIGLSEDGTALSVPEQKAIAHASKVHDLVLVSVHRIRLGAC